MSKIELGNTDYYRELAREARIALVNRFIEPNFVLSDGDPAFISRPGLQYWTTVGDGPIRSMHQQPGAFDGDAFVVSYDKLYRCSRVNASANAVIYSSISGAAQGSAVNMTVTGDIGAIQPHLFWADGSGLFAYTENGYATNFIVFTGQPSDGEQVVMDGVYYEFDNVDVDAGTPDGSSGNPWLVNIGATFGATVTNLYNAINASGVAGTDYSTALTANATMSATAATADTVYVRAAVQGIEGNSLACTETVTNAAWDAASTSGGGDPGVVQVPLPNDVGAIDCANINNYVIVIPAQGQGLNGRFYWIEPGELTIDELNFATAERSADPVNAVEVFNDQFWLMGSDTTEVWYITGSVDAPVLRLQGVVFDRGVHQGTAIQVKDSVILVDLNGGVFQIRGGEKRISTPDIEERLRKAIAAQNARVL